MLNFWLVTKHEVRTMLKKPSFWLLTFLMPGILLAFNAYYMVQDYQRSATGSEEEARTEVATREHKLTIGIVDKSGAIVEIPKDIPPNLEFTHMDEPSARAAIENGELEQYILIPEDFLDSGEITIYDQDFQIFEGGENMGVAFGSENEWTLEYLINFNLAGNDGLARALRNPSPGTLTERHRINPLPEGETNNQALAELVASVVPYIFYFILIISGGYLFRSVLAEKENRTAEVLLLSLQPRELMAGKLLGLSVVALLQMLVWVGGGMLLLNRGADAMNIAAYNFPPGFLLYAIAFLAVGYLLYGSIMAAAGAIAPSAKESTQITLVLIIPFIPTLMFGRTFLKDPHGTIAMVLSLFPLSAPSAMVTRLAVAEVPGWQIFLSLFGLVVSTYFFIVLAGRIFQSENLLSYVPFSWRRFAAGWRN
jgi:ABC-2 type transport system permease protein